jgi:hypothetical protein
MSALRLRDATDGAHRATSAMVFAYVPVRRPHTPSSSRRSSAAQLRGVALSYSQ